VIPDPAINAFAAGHGPDDAVIAVTEGTLRHLTRDELQGVVGHEFSHILNGDSRLNLRLIAVLHGILFIGLVGRGLARGARFGRRREGPALGLLGLGLIAIGFAGTFCGNLIKAAVSRQREFLADAASVQFTRNPGGIAGALKKIGAATAGSALTVPRAAEVSHLFFAQALRFHLGGWLATHPPIEARIRAIEPGWDGKFPALEDGGSPGARPLVASPEAGSPGVRPLVSTSDGADALEVAEARTAIDELGPAGAATRDAYHAAALCYALLSKDGVRSFGDERLNETVSKLHAQLDGYGLMQRLNLVSLSMPALKQMSDAQYRMFVAQVISLIKSDRHIDLFEWVLHRLMLKELRPQFETVVTPPIRYTHIDEVSRSVAVLTAALTAPTADLDAVNDALRELRQLAPLAKPRLLKACLAAISGGKTPSEDQRALLIGIAAALDCPLPPNAVEHHLGVG
jgi:hypothetical protein